MCSHYWWKMFVATSSAFTVLIKHFHMILSVFMYDIRAVS